MRLRKKIVLVLAVVIMLTTFGVEAVFASCVNPPPDLVSWWPGDGNTQDIADSNPGTLTNGASYTTGKVDQAFNLDGVDDYVFIGNPSNLNMSTVITIDAWIKPSAAPSAGQIATIVNKWGQSVATDSYQIYLINNGSGSWVFGGAMGDGATPNGGFTSAPTTIPVGSWTHVAMTYDTNDTTAGPLGTQKIFVNGAQVNVRNRNGIHVATKNVLIGKEDSFLPRYFPGAIDEVEIFDRVLSLTEIQSIYNADTAGKCKPSAGVNTNRLGLFGLLAMVLGFLMVGGSLRTFKRNKGRVSLF